MNTIQGTTTNHFLIDIPDALSSSSDGHPPLESALADQFKPDRVTPQTAKQFNVHC